MRVVFTGGGTGGHLYPALAIARYLQKVYPKIQILFIGTAQGLEAEIVPRAGFNFLTISSQGLKRRFSWSNIKTGWLVLRGLRESRRILKQFAPDLVVGTGGYVCGPVVLMAHWLGIPSAIHEQNAWPGITNRILSRLVSLVMTTFEESKPHFTRAARVEVTGLPIRPEIMEVNRLAGAKSLNLNPQLLTILVVGGSRGAQSINRAMLTILEHYQNRPDIQIVQVTGTLGYEETRKSIIERGLDLEESGNIRVVPYLYDIENALAVADLMICRAGAATLAEISAKGIPSVLIPYPYASENHQEHNARAFEAQGAAVVIKDRDLSGEKLLAAVQELLEEPGRLSRMAVAAHKLGRPQAVKEIVSLLSNYLQPVK
ncbi:MAG: undecaprenyldiphospho-muramoylpentapeptide beta-N-acetylglucosaminyltransferase [Bacillota bacterium]